MKILTQTRKKYKHKLWGEGELIVSTDTDLMISFPKHGMKIISVSAIKHGILKEIAEEDEPAKSVEEHNTSLRQYDKSDTIIGKKNILESFESKDVVIFNESYTVVGETLAAKKISALYDLTVIGDLEADEILVNGNLTVIGNINSNKLNCANYLICQGSIESKEIDVGNIIADSIRCGSFNCEGNAIVKNTIDIDDNCKVERVLFAGEGIVGAGSFSALNAIANEYFEFDGDIEGNIIELISDTQISELSKENNIDLNSLSFAEVVDQFEKRLNQEYEKCDELDEVELAQFLKEIDNIPLATVDSRFRIFNTLTKISYQDTIDEFGDYLITVYAKKYLPKEIYTYETIEHVDGIMLPEADKALEDMEFKPYSVEKIALCIQIVKQCADDIGISSDVALDKIFSSIGLRYNTIKNIISKHRAGSNESKEGKTSTSIGVKEAFLDSTVSSVAKKFNITDFELMKLSSNQVKTCREFLDLTENDFKEMFKKNLYFGNHLWKKQNNMRDELEKLT